MNQPKVTNHSRIRWALAALAVAALLALWWSNRPEYVRYVSPPFGNGTRYTFLYPSRLEMTTWRGTLHPVTVSEGSKMPSPTQQFLWRWMGREQGSTTSSFVSVRTIIRDLPASAKRGLYPQEANIFERRVVLTDPSTGISFHLSHGSTGMPGDAFKREDKVIIGSFRVLPPGAPKP